MSKLMVTNQERSIIIDDLALIGHSLCDEKIIIHTLNGLGDDYKELATIILARDMLVSFEDLYDKLTDYETYLKHEDKLPGLTIIAQVSHKSKRKGTRYPPNISKGLANTHLDPMDSMRNPPYPPNHNFSESGNSNNRSSWHPAPPSHQRRVVC